MALSQLRDVNILHFHSTLRRLPCSTPLVRLINLSSGSKRLCALNCYVSKSLSDAIQRILLCKGMHDKIEPWRNRCVQEGYYADVYDGKVWKSFMNNRKGVSA